MGSAIAIPVGLWLGHMRRGQFLAIGLSNVGRAVPSLALIAFFVAYLGTGFVNVTLALVLGAVGVYGVISHFVQRRSREYGIRLALGQSPAKVVGQVLRRGVALVALGSAIGVAAAPPLGRLLGSLVFGVGADEPLSMAGAVSVLLVVGVLAAFVPARRASLTDPAAVLRHG